MTQGDLVLLPFPFTDLTGSKIRPALVLMSTAEDITVAFITTQLKWTEKFDLLLKPSEENGLKRESVVRLNKIATIDKSLVLGILGTVSSSDILSLHQQLKALFRIE